VLFLIFLTVLADDAKLELVDEPVPEQFSQTIQGLDYMQAMVVSLNGQPSAKIWLSNSVKSSDSPSAELGVTFGKIETGSFVGVIEILKDWKDYKMNPIKPGHYTMRYGIMPADGNHMGVSSYRDYLLLIPGQHDVDPAKVLSYEELVTSSFEATGIPHPAVLALYPVWEEVTEPKLVKNDLDQWTVGIRIGGETLGLTVEGHGEIH